MDEITEKIFENNSEQTQEGIPSAIPSGISKEIHEDIPGEIPDRIKVEILEKLLVEFPKDPILLMQKKNLTQINNNFSWFQSKSVLWKFILYRFAVIVKKTHGNCVTPILLTACVNLIHNTRLSEV